MHDILVKYLKLLCMLGNVLGVFCVQIKVTESMSILNTWNQMLFSPWLRKHTVFQIAFAKIPSIKIYSIWTFFFLMNQWLWKFFTDRVFSLSCSLLEPGKSKKILCVHLFMETETFFSKFHLVLVQLLCLMYQTRSLVYFK